MKNPLLLMMIFLSNAAHGDEWIALRPQPKTSPDAPQIFIDPTSIEILASGVRRAKSKTDFALAARAPLDNYPPGAVSFMIFINSYDCEKGLVHPESHEAHLLDGTVLPSDDSQFPKWYPRNDAADPAFAFVCDWQGL